MSFALAFGYFVKLHSCAYGGERKKLTAFLCSDQEFLALERFCDESHAHKGWGYDHGNQECNTAKEAGYPKMMCEACASILETITFGRVGFLNDSRVSSCERKAPTTAKGSHDATIISEFAAVRAVVSKLQPPLNNKKLLSESWQALPKGAKLLRTEAKRGGVFLFVFGFFRNMRQFVDVAKQLWHPFDELRNLPDCWTACIFRCMSMGPVEMTKQRIQTLKLWGEWEKELRCDEAALHARLHHKVAQVLEGKNLLLLQKLANEINWPDKGIHDEIQQGFELTGYAPPSGIFKTELRPAEFGKDRLLQDAKFLKPLLLGKGGISSECG